MTFVTPLLMATLGWFALSALVSYEPMLAARRMPLAVFTIFNAAAVLMLPDDGKHFARLLAWAAVILLALCYLSIVVMPDRAIHQSHDILGEDLTGNWRGAFAHKNSAGAAMVILIFIGIFVARSLNMMLGIAIVVSSAVFLYYTRAKSPIMLLPAVIVVSFGLMHLRSAAARILTVVCFTGFFMVITIGSVEFKPIHDALSRVMKDPTFTGRDEIWTFTLAHISERPLVGFGFEAFWGTSRLLEEGAINEWVTHTSDAHNSTLNLAVTTGIVGAALALSWILIQTIVDYVRTPAGAADVNMSRLFIQVWLFGLSVSSFESVFFVGGSLVWFMVLMSMAGIRFQRRVAEQSHAAA
jgi:O-antigen ligase